MKQSTVAVVKVRNNIGEALDKLINCLGGLDSVILPLETVMIKPDWSTEQSYESGAVTHPGLLKALIKKVLNCGTKQVLVGDASMVGLKTTEKAIHDSGINELGLTRVKTIDFKKSEYMEVGISNALRFRRLSFPKEYMQSQVIINVPVMKTHNCLPAALGLKNLKSILKDEDRKRILTFGLEEGLIDVNRIALADLTIIDGIIGMDGDGPFNGTPANADVLIGSTDPLAAEAIAIEIMGFGETPMRYMELAYQAGFGEINLDRINLVGDPIEQVKRKFQNPSFHQRIWNDGRIKINQKNACGSCRYILNQYLKRYEKELLAMDDDMELYMGIIDNGICGEDKCTVGIGNCTLSHKDELSMFIDGCPPSVNSLRMKLKSLKNRESKK